MNLFLKLNAVVFDWCVFCHLLALFVLFMQRVRTARQEVLRLKYTDLCSLSLSMVFLPLPEWDAQFERQVEAKWD